MSSDGSVLFTHDARGRLTKVTVGSSVTSYLIDGRGQRIRKSGGPAGTVYFVFDEAGHLLGEYSSNGLPVQEFVWLGDTPVALLSGAGTLIDNSTAASVVIAGTWSTATAPRATRDRTSTCTLRAGPARALPGRSIPQAPAAISCMRAGVRIHPPPDATYTVTHAAGSTALTVDQRSEGGQWIALGTFSFTRNAGHTVRLDASPNGTLAADAMKLVPASAATYYVYPDHLDTPRIVTDTLNNLRWRWLADPFGVSLPENNPSGLGALTLNLRFPGQYFDVETALHYNYFPGL